MPGHMYVALSRVISFAWLILIGNGTKVVLKVNNAAANEYDGIKAAQAVWWSTLKKSYQNLIIRKYQVRMIYLTSFEKKLIFMPID